MIFKWLTLIGGILLIAYSIYLSWEEEWNKATFYLLAGFILVADWTVELPW